MIFFYLFSVDPSDFLGEIQEASENNDVERVEGLLCGAVKILRSTRSKPDPCLYLSLMYLVKSKPSMFLSELVTEVGKYLKCSSFTSYLVSIPIIE